MGEMNDRSDDETFAQGRILVVALKGWNDAGEAASSAVKTLAQALDITSRAELIDDELFFDYSINRPHSIRTAAGERRILWPHVELLTPTGHGGDDAAGVDAVGDTETGDADAPARDPEDARFDLERDSDLLEGPGTVPLFSIADLGDRVARARDDDRDQDESDAHEVRALNLAGDAEMRITAANHDNVYVLLGHEPTLHWRAFTARVLELCELYGVTRIVLVGALLADVPHSRPINVFVSSEHRPFRDELNIGRSEYQGPTGVLGAISLVAEQHDIPTVSVWASVPHYASQPPSPKAELAVIDKLEELLDVTIPRADLIERSEHWEGEVDAATNEDTDIAEYIDYLERAHDMVEAPEASGEAIAKEFERFLRQGDGRADTARSPQAQSPWSGSGPKSGTARADESGDAFTQADDDGADDARDDDATSPEEPDERA